MSRSDLLHQIEKASLDEIEKLREVDGYSWWQLSELALYKGESSMKNIVRQAAHSLSFHRGLKMMKTLSNDGNHRLHRLSLDTMQWMIVPRPAAEKATGELKEIHHQMIPMMYRAESALEAGNSETLKQYKDFLLRLVSKVESEIQACHIMCRLAEEG